MVEEVKIKKDASLGIWQGLGGAITEATAYNFAKLSPEKQQKLINAYFGKAGLNYRWIRLCIGSNDFCLKPYEYTKKSDLSDFSIKHDRKYVLPMLKMVLKDNSLTIMASPWSPPKCLKLVQGQKLSGRLKPWRYKAYAKYIHKWLEEYAKEGVKVDYITPQNEPLATQVWESCVFSYQAQKKLAYKYLENELSDLNTQILLWDHNKSELVKAADKLFEGKFVTKFGQREKIAGLCYHWYDGTFPDQMWQVRQKYPNILMVSSEMSCGFSPYNKELWQKDATLYWRELFNDINSGTSAFIDWNMLLSWQGGPNHSSNYVKSPVILNEKEDDFILTPIYFALKKFADLFPAGSEVVRCESNSDKIVAVARKTKDGYRVVIANVSGSEQDVTIEIGGQKKNLHLARFEIDSVNV
ncbi:hypothetical protein IKG28_00850 [Candidatus Saccharibacteria bacterium]|nr:hypothetical protein [Candidatus Saccharibacteria bacterium]MBR3143817.1 hypothetical protein [Candidatus Saccharibacteria bacterium]MBR3332168.1 hypothetical protein [Candidatus Saccharibacteria bacterium]